MFARKLRPVKDVYDVWRCNVSSTGYLRYDFLVDNFALISIINHIDINRIDKTALISLFSQLVSRISSAELLVPCIHHLADRCTDVYTKVEIMSAGLRECPIRPIREVLMTYGGSVLDGGGDDVVYYAAGNGMIDIVQKALVSGSIDIRTPCKSKHRPILYNAVCSNDVLMVKLLIQHGATVNYEIASRAVGHSALDILEVMMTHGLLDVSWRMWAYVHDVACASWLLRHKFHKNDAIFEVARNNHLDVLQYLIETVNIKVCRGALHRLVQTYPDLSIVSYLLLHGCDICDKDRYDNTVLRFCLLYTRYLIDNGCDVLNVPNVDCQTILMCCPTVTRPSLLKIFKNKVNLHDALGRTPLHFACFSRGCDLSDVKALVHAGAVVNDVNPVTGESPIHVACCSYELMTMKMKLLHGFDVSTHEHSPRTPDHVDIRRRVDIVQYLIQCGANVNAVDNIYNTPLHYAYVCCDSALVVLLLKSGACPNARNLVGKLPADSCK